jgi:hypothetical protein
VRSLAHVARLLAQDRLETRLLRKPRSAKVEGSESLDGDTPQGHINGGIELKEATDASPKEILREIRRVCPELQRISSDPKVYVGKVLFYQDYRLVALQWEGEEKSVVGFYAEGDFRPLDRSGDSIRQLNAIAPLQLLQLKQAADKQRRDDKLTRDAVLSYVLLRLACEEHGYNPLFAEFLLSVTPTQSRLILRDAGDREFSNHNSRSQKTSDREEQLKKIRRELCFSLPLVDLPPNDSSETPGYRVSVSRIVGLSHIERVSVVVDGDGDLTARKQAEITLEREEYLPRGYGIRVSFTPRLDTSPAVQSWRLLSKGDEPTRLLEAFKKFRARPASGVDTLGAKEHDDNGETLVRKADFGSGQFYKGFDLVEVVANWPANPGRTYALVGTNPNGELDVHPLNMLSSVIHEVNEKDKLMLDTDERRKAYLRFFCWCTHAGGDPFLIPLCFHDVRYARAAGRELRESADELRDHNYDSFRISADKDAATTRWKAVVLHGQSAFDVEFTLHNDGGVEMDQDTQFAEGLALRDDRDGQQILVASNGNPAMHADGPQPPEASQQPQREIDVDHGDAVAPPEGDSDIGPDPTVADVFAAGATRIEGHTFSEHLRIDKTSAREFFHCTFKNGVAAGDGLGGLPLTFEHCTFREGENGEYNAIDFHSAELGGLRLTRSLIVGRIYAPNLRITGNLSIEGCNVVPKWPPPSDFPRETTEKEPTQLKRVLEIAKSDESFIGSSVFGPEPVITLDRGVISGDLAITAVLGKRHALDASASEAAVGSPDFRHRLATSVYGAVTMKRIEVQGTTSLFGCRVGGDADLSRGDFKKGLLYWCPEWNLGAAVQFHADGRLLLIGARVGDPLDLTLVQIEGDLRLDHTIVRGSITADLTLISANVDGRSVSTFPGPDAADPSKCYSMLIGGDLVLTGARVGAVEFAGIKVGGAVRAKEGKFGRFSMAPGIARNANRSAWIRPSTIGAMELSQFTVAGDVDLADIQIILPAKRRQTGDLRKLTFGCTIVEATIGGNLTFSNSDPSRVFARRWRAAEVKDEPIWAPSRVQDSRPDNRSRLLPGYPSCEDMSANVWGGLDLHGNKIGGDLNLQNMRVEGPIKLGDTTVARDVRIGATYSLSGFPVPMLETHCRDFNAEMFSCEGDTDLTGLCSDQGIHARGAIVKGDLLLVPPRNDRQSLAEGHVDADWYARIKNGGIDLTAAQADRLTLSGDNVNNSDKNTSSGDPLSEKNDVNLERGHFNLLEIVDPTPGKINLSQMSVGGWEFGGPNKDSHAGGSDSDMKAKAYCDVLSQMEPFDRSVWINVENRFREEGLDADANRVYRKMRTVVRTVHPIDWSRKLRDWRTYLGLAVVAVITFGFAIRFGVPRSYIPRLMLEIAYGYFVIVAFGWHITDRIIAVTTSYGTRVWKPMILWVPFFIVSAWIFSDPNNVRVSTPQAVAPPKASDTVAAFPGIEKTQPTAAVLHEHWTLLDGIAVAMRYQVPIIHIDTHHRWEASSRQVLHLPLTAEDWAFIVSFFSWLVWPVVLIAVTAKAVRGVRH